MAGAIPTSHEVGKMVDYASDLDLFHDHSHSAYATISVGAHRETWNIRSGPFRAWLAQKFFKDTGKTPHENAVISALSVIEGKAIFVGPERVVSLRIAECPDGLLLDLMNDTWQVVHVTKDGWSLIPGADCPGNVRFRRARGAVGLPCPTRGGNLEDLKPFLNLPPDDEDNTWVMMISWLLGAFNPKGPYPLLLVHGEQGSAKSTTCRVLRSMIDPNTSPLRSPPGGEQDLMITATNSWVVALENMSNVPRPMSNSLCRLATGAGFSSRQLYTDADEFILDAARPIMLNGIDEFVVQADLLDRSIWMMLPQIPPSARRTEKSIYLEVDEVRPGVLGCLLDALVVGLKNRGKVRPRELPRMADFALWVLACEPGLPWAKGKFLEIYTHNRTAATEIALSSVPIVQAITRLAETEIRWSGTATELLQKLEFTAQGRSKRNPGWPASAWALGNQLRRVKAALETAGVGVDYSFSRGRRKVTVYKIAGGDAPH